MGKNWLKEMNWWKKRQKNLHLDLDCSKQKVTGLVKAMRTRLDSVKD
jgi:hypothetical protein